MNSIKQPSTKLSRRTGCEGDFTTRRNLKVKNLHNVVQLRRYFLPYLNSLTHPRKPAIKVQPLFSETKKEIKNPADLVIWSEGFNRLWKVDESNLSNYVIWWQVITSVFLQVQINFMNWIQSRGMRLRMKKDNLLSRQNKLISD